jgi:hypothetical protein
MDLICGTCKVSKPVTDFYGRGDKKGSRRKVQSKCKSCVIEYHRQQRNPEKWKGKDLKARFGIGFDEYARMFQSQNGKCAICDKHQAEFNIKFAVDHCHQTGKIRGLLCVHCNHGLGKFFDRTDLLRKSIEYLESGG